jgi:hypothetical protein
LSHANSPWILLADASGTIRGLAHTGALRSDVAHSLQNAGMLYSGWTGYVPVPPGTESITAYLLMKSRHPCRIGTQTVAIRR